MQRIALLCAVAMILGVGTANALDLEWTLLMDSSIAGAEPTEVSPGKYLVLPGSTGSAGCNFSTEKGCDTAATPNEGSYSFSAMEFDPALTHACLDLSGGPYAGAPCVCADPPGQPCTGDEQCSSSGSCAGAGDCCPGPLSRCNECEKNPDGPDLFSYNGIDATLGPAPNLDMCQVHSSNDFEMARYQIAGSGNAETAGGCTKLSSLGAPHVGSPCGLGQISGTFGIETYLAGCTLKVVTLPNISYVGDVIDVDDPNPTSQCGYTESQLLTMLAQASAKGGEYLRITCGTTTVPGDTTAPCLRNAEAQFITVAWTADDVTDCTGTCQ
jgi:hypothetical protein